jgi:hypothetical protein
MKEQEHEHQILHIQDRNLVFKVLNISMRQLEKEGPICSVANLQKRTADACDVDVRTVKFRRKIRQHRILVALYLSA